MSRQWEIVGQSGLQFFGKISASISHDVKNALAVINESAGLLEDISIMAKKGMPLDPERVMSQARMIMKQIQKADGIAKNLNRFAHSVDAVNADVDLGGILEFMCSLCGRFASLGGVRLALQAPRMPIGIRTNTFYLENLIWLCLDFAIAMAGSGKTVTIGLEGLERGSRVTLSGLDKLPHVHEVGFPDETVKALLEALKVACELHSFEGKLALSFPSVLP